MNRIGTDSTLEDAEFTDINGDFDDISGLQGDIDAELDQILTDFDGGDLNDTLEVRVYRPLEGKGKVAYVFACLPTELPILDKLRDEYGGGDFEVRLLKNKRIFRKFQVCVEAPKSLPATRQVDPSASLATAMTEGFTRLGELMVQMNANNAPPQQLPDPITMQTAMMQNMVTMKELMGGGQRAPDPLKQMQQLMELKKAFGESEVEKESSTNDVLVALINNVMPVLGNIGAAESKAISGRGTKQPAPTNKPDPQQSEEIKTMKLQLMYLCGMAKKGVDPAPYALMVLDNTPDENLQQLLAFVSAENAIEQMASIHKSVGLYPEWFMELGRLVVEYAEVDEDGYHDLTESGENVTFKGADTTQDASNVPEQPQSQRKGRGDLTVDPLGEGGDVGHTKDDEGYHPER